MEIAVVGIACRYPGANSAREFIENILAGRRYFREIPAERWALSDYYDADRSAPDRTYCKQAAVLEGFEFNPSAFRIPQSTHRATDLAQWLALTVAKDALDDADIADPPRASTAVILGNTLTGETSRAHLVRYRWPYAKRVFDELLSSLGIVGEHREQILARVEERYKRPFPPVNEDNLAGGLANTIAGRICNFFDFKGGGYTVDGACSSSLLSIQEASIGLQQGLCDLALAGGVDMSLDPFELVGFAKVGALSDSDIRVYDQRANGFLPGEGCGIVVLKRLADAVQDGNRVYGVIRGVGYSSDGRGGITAPSVAGQSLAVDRAYLMAGYSFADVELIEGHGTGTPVGDRTELQTFIDAKLRHRAADDHRCGIGSIKSIIGHTKAAAGVAGFIKAILAAYYRVLPPTMGLSMPNELFTKTTHIYPLMRGRRWRSATGYRAAVSSAGFGGINTHITMEGYRSPGDARARELDVDYLLQSQQNAELFLLTADDAADLRAKVSELVSTAKRLCHAELGDLASECARNAGAKAFRLAVVADTAAALHEKLLRTQTLLDEKLAAGGEIELIDTANGVFLRRAKRLPRVAFLYPGQGTQHLDMGRRMRERYAFADAHWRICDTALEGMLPKPLSSYVLRESIGDQVETRTHAEALRHTSVAQPAIVATSMANTEVLRYLGVEPELVVGHSLGEYTALWCAGAMEKAEVLRVVAARGAAMSACSDVSGGMLSLPTDAATAETLIASVKAANGFEHLAIANLNAPTQTVVSGDTHALGALEALCALSELPASRLDVSGAFHSPLMMGAQQRLAQALQTTRFGELDRLMISTTTGGFLHSTSTLRELLGQQLVNPVRFTEAITAAASEGVDAFVDVGPMSILYGLTRRILGPSGPPVFAADLGDSSDWTGLLQTVGYMYVSGLPVVPTRLFENRFVRRFALPYRPKFITSPCEAAAEPLTLDFAALDLSAVHLLPLKTKEVTSAPVERAVVHTPVAKDAVGEMFDFIRHFVMERFGYPAELVTPGARLLEDLNLDSIKSAEVIGEAMARAQTRADPSLYAKMSLGDIAARLVGAQAEASIPAAIVTPAKYEDSWVRVFEAKLVPQPLRPAGTPIASRQIMVAAMAHDDSAPQLVRQLADLGHRVGLWRHGQAHPATPFDTCIISLPANHNGTSDGATALLRIAEHAFSLPEFLLETAQALGTRVVRSKTNGAARSVRPVFALVMRSGSLLAQAGCADRWDPSPAAAAFMKSWYLEYPGSEVRVLDLDTDVTEALVAERLIAEIDAGGGFVEAAFTRTGQRQVIEWLPTATSLMRASPLGIQPDDVLVVTGGAKGITAECIKALLSEAPMRVALLGSSAVSDNSDDPIQRMLTQLAEQGITARYYQCDVVDGGAVRACIARIVADLGAIRGLVHAAGLNVPHRIDAVNKPAFRAVLDPKMQGLLNLLQATNVQDLRHLAVLSSIIGVSGMPGNADYAYANAWMGLALRRFADAYPHIQCRAFAYSVWDEVGMGARLGSIAGLRRQGIAPIPPALGVRRFVELMQRQWRTPELVISARTAGLDTIRYADVVADDLPFAAHVIASQPGVELVCEALLDPKYDHYLADHNYNGALLFPAVVGMEAMAQVALRCVRVILGDVRAPLIENMRFVRPIVVPAEGRRIRIYAQADEPQQDGSVRVRVQIRSSLGDYDADSFSAECVWRDSPAKAKTASVASWPQPLSIQPREQLYGSLFFQGPAFQHVTALHDVSGVHCIAQVAIPTPVENNTLTGAVLGSAAVRDCFLHAIQVCVPQYRILPIGIESLETFGLHGLRAYLVANERSHTEREFVYDIDVLSDTGQLLEQIRGYQCRIVDAYQDQQTLAVIARLHAQARERDVATPVAAAQH